jgi:hypothetical protein
MPSVRRLASVRAPVILLVAFASVPTALAHSK